MRITKPRLNEPLWHEGFSLTQQHFQHRVHADEVLAKLETPIRDLLDAIIPSRVVAIGLSSKSPTTWSGQIHDERLTNSAVDWYLSINSSIDAFDLVGQFPRLCKVGAPDEVDHIANAALPGIALKAVQRAPTGIPVRLDNLYFALDSNSPALARMPAARACQICLPVSIADASVELYAVLRS